MLAYESQLERDLYTLLEFDPMVRTVQEQPVRIPFLDSRGRLAHYTPDCLVEYHAGSGSRRPSMLVEVKHRRDLFPLWPKIHAKLRAAARYARRRGQTFRILTEREIRGPRLENARWLMAYRSLPIPEPETKLIPEALRALKRTSTPLELLGFVCDSEPKKEQLLVAIWHAIANGYIQANLDVKLCMSAPIWVSEESL